MRKQYTIILLFFLAFHFLLPSLYFAFYGFVNLYSDVQGYEGMVLNLITLLGAICVIRYMPSKEKATFAPYKHTVSFFVIASLISIYKFVSAGGYEGALAGNANGSLISFVSLFFNINAVFLLMFCLQKNLRHVYLLICAYVLMMTGMGSRSAVVGVLFLIFYLPLFYNYKTAGRKLKKILIVLAVVSPAMFMYATLVRTDVDRDLLAKLIVGRISFVELSMIPLQGQKDGSMDQKVFDAKYSMSNQLRQSVNAVSPIDPFEGDVAPNQYFRQIFSGASESRVLNSYMSINMTLPVYFVMRTNYVTGILLTILFLAAVFCIWVRFASNRYVFFSILFSLYDLLYYFDWVMIVQSVFVVCLTIFGLDMYEKGMNSLIFTYRKYFYSPSGLLKEHNCE